jgi:hypothetical protein
LDLAAPIEPLTRRQRAIVILVAVVCALSRLLALARSVWDWDEVQFVMALRDYDVTLHHPHPPGFPVYLALGNLAKLVVRDEFRALQSINLLTAFLVFPALFLFARELRLRFATSVMAAALFAFFPNVWFFGGGAFSDIPSIVLVLFAVTFMLRGAGPEARHRNAYWIGTFLLALAIGIRPQNLLVGLIPGIYATRKRRPHEIAIALLIGVVIVGAAFGGAIYATGSVEQYTRMVREHGDYITRVDSWRSPDRPPLWRLFDRFFIKQYQFPAWSIIASLFALISIAGAIRDRNRALAWNALTFVPFAIFAWMMLDRFSISRFSIGYQPMFAIFVADGVLRAARQNMRVALAFFTVLIGGFIAYTLPAMTPVRNDVAPSILAARAAAKTVPQTDPLFVGHTMTVFMDLEAPGFPYTRVIDDRAMPLSRENRPGWLLAEITETPREGLLFLRERGNLWNIARRHYFEVKLHRITRRPQFVSGWYSAETNAHDEWRWTSGRSVTLLPPGRGRTMLRLHLGIPRETMPLNPKITIKLNGKIVDEFHTTAGYLERDYRVEAAPGGLPNLLEMSVDRVVRPRDDTRVLGLRVRYFAWGPA